MLSQFRAIGHALCSQGLVSSASGNLSIRKKDRLVITHRGCDLSSLVDRDLVETGIFADDTATPSASSELPVHRCIYGRSQARTVVHAHPLYAVALSIRYRAVAPSDLEGRLVLGDVPVIGDGERLLPGEFGEEIAAALQCASIVLVRGHGSFAVGEDLRQGYYRTLVLERSCRVLYLLMALPTPL